MNKHLEFLAHDAFGIREKTITTAPSHYQSDEQPYGCSLAAPFTGEDTS
ncbi:not available [Yersinia enterocolitica]|nr:not available [Yersinia enterocolitica]